MEMREAKPLMFESIAEKIFNRGDDTTESVTKSARKLWRHPIVLSMIGAVILTGALDAQSVSQQPKQTCTHGQIAVSVPGIHILSAINNVVRGLPFTKQEPTIRDVVALRTPDVAISAIVKANGLSGPMGTVPSQYGGVRCLTVPGVTKIAQETMILPAPAHATPKRVKSAPLSAVPSTLSRNVAIGKRLATAHGWTGGQWSCLYTLWKHESQWDESAKNPTSSAYGIAQFLTDTWSSVGGKKTADPTTQITLGIKYIDQRYGTPCGAWNFWWNVAPHRPPFNGHWY